MTQRIGLFGGSFDPVHFGHQKIAKSFLESGHLDALWVLPTASPPHKTGKTLTAYPVRCQMAEAAFRGWPAVEVNRVEEHLPAPNYTLQTVRHLKNRYPGNTFILCIGSDSLQQITTWYRYRELLSECELLVAKRPDYEVSETPSETILRYAEHQPVSFGSTEIRGKIRRGEDVGDLVPEEVLALIDTYKLYKP